MNWLRTNLLSTGLPPQKKQVEKVGADIILIHSVVVDHSAEAFDRKYTDGGVLV